MGAFGVHPFFEAILAKQRPNLRFVLLERREEEEAVWRKDRDIQIAV